MLTKLRSRINSAHLLALVALFVALGSGAYAASKIGSQDIRKNAVRGKHIKRNQVKSGDVKNENLKGKDVKDGSLTGDDVKDESLGGADIDENSLSLPENPLIPRAVARINSDGSVDVASESVNEVTHPSDGVYCFDLAFDAAHAVATVEGLGNFASDRIISALVRPDAAITLPLPPPGPVGDLTVPANCPGDEDAQVEIVDPRSSSGADRTYQSVPSNAAFHVAFY